MREAFVERTEKKGNVAEIPMIEVLKTELLPDRLNYQQEPSGRLIKDYFITKEAEGWTIFSVYTADYDENIIVTL